MIRNGIFYITEVSSEKDRYYNLKKAQRLIDQYNKAYFARRKKNYLASCYLGIKDIRLMLAQDDYYVEIYYPTEAVTVYAHPEKEELEAYLNDEEDCLVFDANFSDVELATKLQRCVNKKLLKEYIKNHRPGKRAK